MENLPDMTTPEMQRTQMAIAEQMGPTAIRYDEIYYPRTDKRAISKYPWLSCGSFTFFVSGQPVHLRRQPVFEGDS